jgi:hypothetical protein
MTSTTAKVIKLPLKGLDAATEDLLFWKSPLKTGVVLAGALLLLFCPCYAAL